MDNMEINLKEIHEACQHAINNPVELPNYTIGKSIVTSCYRESIPGTYILLSELYRLDMNIPIEVFYRDGELDDNETEELSNIWPGHIFFKKIRNNISNFKDKWGNVKGWGTKVYAIVESEFSENLWIDSDNVPIKHCLSLFDDTEYKEKGSLFWRDVYSVDRSDQYCSSSNMWKLFGIEPNDGEPFESGQFLINKPVVWNQLNLMMYYTNNSQLYYNYGGDAECWRMAWQLINIAQGKYHTSFNYHASNEVPYGFMPYGPFHKGVQNQWHKYGGGTVMVQRDRNGDELFNHRNITKWSWKNENPYNEDIKNESTYHLIMRHIKTKYGVI